MGIARSGIVWFVAKVVALGSTWVASMYFARALADPTTTLGQFYVFETIVSFFMLATNGGVNAAIRKRVSEGEDPEAYAGGGVIISAVLVTMATILVFLASPLIVDYFGQGGLTVLFIVGLIWALQARNTATAILEGHSKVGRSGGISLIDAAGQASIQTVLVFFGFGLLGLMGGAFASTSVASLFALALLGGGVKRPTAKHIKSLLSFAKFSFLHGFTTKFYDNIDIIVITAFIGSAATGIYGIGFRFGLILQMFTSAISTSSLPEISHCHARGETERIEEILTDAIIFGAIFAIPAFFGMLVIAEPLIVTFFTGAFRDATVIATIAVAIQIPDSFRSIFSTTMDAIDRPDITFRSGVILIVTNVLLDLVLVPTVGIVGAVIASFVGISLATGYLTVRVLDELDLSWHSIPFWPLLTEVVAAAIMGATVYTVKEWVPMPRVASLLLLVGVGILTYFLLLLSMRRSIRRRSLGVAHDFLPE